MFYSPKKKNYKFSFEKESKEEIKNVKEDNNIPLYIKRIEEEIPKIEKTKNIIKLKEHIDNLLKIDKEKNFIDEEQKKELFFLKKEIKNIIEEKEQKIKTTKKIKVSDAIKKETTIKQKINFESKHKNEKIKQNYVFEKQNKSKKLIYHEKKVKLIKILKNKKGTSDIIKNIKHKIKKFLTNLVQNNTQKIEKKSLNKSLNISDIKTLIPSYKKVNVNISKNEKNEFENLYTVRFGLIYSKLIYNFASPEHVYPLTNEEKNNKELKKRIGEEYIKYFNEKIGFYEKLENSIKNEGIRNPIICNSGEPKTRMLEEVDDEYLKNIPYEKRLFCEFMGGSRLYICQKNDWFVPCIIVDWTNGFKSYKKLETIKEINEMFIDKTEIKFTNIGLSIKAPEHVHIENQGEEKRLLLSKIRRDFFLSNRKENF